MNKKINSETYRGYRINCGKKDKSPCNSFTLDQGIDRLEYMSENHNKVLCIRLDLHQPSESEKPIRGEMAKILEKGLRKLEAEFRKKKNKPDPHYVWRAEQASSKHEHIHAFFMVNCDAIQNGYRLKKIFNNALKSHYHTDKDGLVEFCPSNGEYGKRIERNSHEFKAQMNEAVFQMSYLSKSKYDKNRPKGARLSSASRLPRKG